MSEIIELLVGGGFLLMSLGIFSIFANMGRSAKAETDLDVKYYLMEEVSLGKFAKTKHNIDLDKEAIKKELMKDGKKDFRRRLQHEIVEDMFGKDDEEKKK